MGNEAAPLLNESQRRHYEVLFARLERTLVQLEAAARDDDARTALTIVESDLPPRFTQEAPEVIDVARQQLAALARMLSLRPRVESRRRICRALITSDLNGLTDATSARLRGFGAVDSSIATHLDPALEKLRATVSRLPDLFEESPTHADDRLPRTSLGRVEGSDGIVESRHGTDVRSQSSVPHPLDDLAQLSTIGLDDEVDSQTVGGACLARPDDGHQRSSGSNQARRSFPD